MWPFCSRDVRACVVRAKKTILKFKFLWWKCSRCGPVLALLLSHSSEGYFWATKCGKWIWETSISALKIFMMFQTLIEYGRFSCYNINRRVYPVGEQYASLFQQPSGSLYTGTASSRARGDCTRLQREEFQVLHYPLLYTRTLLRHSIWNLKKKH